MTCKYSVLVDDIFSLNIAVKAVVFFYSILKIHFFFNLTDIFYVLFFSYSRNNNHLNAEQKKIEKVCVIFFLSIFCILGHLS